MADNKKWRLRRSYLFMAIIIIVLSCIVLRFEYEQDRLVLRANSPSMIIDGLMLVNAILLFFMWSIHVASRLGLEGEHQYPPFMMIVLLFLSVLLPISFMREVVVLFELIFLLIATLTYHVPLFVVTVQYIGRSMMSFIFSPIIIAVLIGVPLSVIAVLTFVIVNTLVILGILDATFDQVMTIVQSLTIGVIPTLLFLESEGFISGIGNVDFENFIERLDKFNRRKKLLFYGSILSSIFLFFVLFFMFFKGSQ